MLAFKILFHLSHTFFSDLENVLFHLSCTNSDFVKLFSIFYNMKSTPNEPKEAKL